MTEPRTTSQEVRAEILDAVRKSQEAVVDAIKRAAGTFQSIAPSLPAVPRPSVPRLPYADKLPKPEELVASAYDFAEKLLASQRSFAESVLEAAKPLTSGRNGTTPPKSGSTAN